MRNLDIAKTLATAIDCPRPDCLAVNRSKALLDSAGHADCQSVDVGSHRRESVTIEEYFLAAEA
jgi:hypothetical protein